MFSGAHSIDINLILCICIQVCWWIKLSL